MIDVMIAEDHGIMREGLRALFEDDSDIRVVAECANGLDVLETYRNVRPDIVLLDVVLPGMTGIEIARHLVREDEDVKILALSMHDDRRYVNGMLKAGAFGYLLKEVAYEELMIAIRVVNSGEGYLSAGVTGVVVNELRKHTGASATLSALTDREAEILKLISEGSTTKEIAYSIQLSPKTVESHRRNLMNKLGIFNVADLTKLAIREGLTSL